MSDDDSKESKALRKKKALQRRLESAVTPTSGKLTVSLTSGFSVWGKEVQTAFSSSPDYAHWGMCSTWTVEQALILLIGMDPDLVTLEFIRRYGQGLSQDRLNEIVQTQRLLLTHYDDGVRDAQARPIALSPMSVIRCAD